MYMLCLIFFFVVFSLCVTWKDNVDIPRQKEPPGLSIQKEINDSIMSDDLEMSIRADIILLL